MNFDAAPIWAIFLGAFALVLLSIEAGHRLGAVAHRRSAEEKESPASGVAGAGIGLLAFMLAFTFSIASERFDDRKALVREEANAIRTANHRADFLPEADRAEARRLFREYLDERLALARMWKPSPAAIRETLSTSARIQDRLWAMAVENARKDMNSDVAALYIESLNHVTDVHALRLAVGVQGRIPVAIWGALVALTTLGMALMGYHTGIAGSRRSATGLMLALAFSLTIAMIAALDRPGGVIRVPHQPLIDLRESMGHDADAGAPALAPR